MDPGLLVGITGAAIILIAFVLNETHVWGEDELRYDVANLLGSGLLLTYSWIIASWPFAVLNGVWALMSLRDVILDMRRGQSGRPRP